MMSITHIRSHQVTAITKTKGLMMGVKRSGALTTDKMSCYKKRLLRYKCVCCSKNAFTAVTKCIYCYINAFTAITNGFTAIKTCLLLLKMFAAIKMHLLQLESVFTAIRNEFTAK